MTSQHTLSSLSDSLADAVEAATKGVVRIRSGRRVATGVAWSVDGQIVTVAGAVGRNQTASVTLPTGMEVEATVKGIDPALDIALLHVDSDLTPIERVDGSDLRVGSIALVVGRPGRSVRAALGLVSGRSDEAWTTPMGAKVDRFIDVDSSLPPGFGGGALVDSDGYIVGMNSRGLVRGGTTIPSDTVERAVQQLAEHGTRARGWLGVRFEAVTLEGEDATAADAGAGLLVRKAAESSPASEAGVRIGDVLLSLDGKPLGTWRELAQALAGAAGRPQPLRVLRGGAAVELTVTPSEKRGLRC
ncbi:MAG: serine protease [Deltaproteobacteria bacterium]|nr:serine protease [Deltaproteobacteria bacterium]